MNAETSGLGRHDRSEPSLGTIVLRTNDRRCGSLDAIQRFAKAALSPRYK
jgi:hypothetical protein